MNYYNNNYGGGYQRWGYNRSGYNQGGYSRGGYNQRRRRQPRQNYQAQRPAGPGRPGGSEAAYQRGLRAGQRRAGAGYSTYRNSGYYR